MILSIDFGGAVAKVLAAHENGDHQLIEYPLGFKTRPRWSLPEAIQYIIADASGGRKPRSIYASGEIASVQLKDLLSEPPLDPVMVYDDLKLPVVDVGHTITYVLGEAFRGDLHAADVCKFLPRKITELEVENYLGNKDVYPQLIPVGEREHSIEQALARVKITQAVGQDHTLADINELVLTGAVFAKAPSLSQALLILLDIVSLPPVVEIHLDTKQLLPALATLSVFKKNWAEKILQQEPFLVLGNVFSHPEELVLTLDLGLREPLVLDLAAEEVRRIPLEKGQTAPVEFDSPSQKGSFEVNGGELGFIVDTRSKPLPLPSLRHERWGLLKAWEEALSTAKLE